MSSTINHRLATLVGVLFALSAVGCSSADDQSGRADFAHTVDLGSFIENDLSTSDDLSATQPDLLQVPDMSSFDASPTGCTEIMVNTFSLDSEDGTSAAYAGFVSPDTGDTSDPDAVSLEFYGSAFDPTDNGEMTGTFDLTMGGDANYATCSRCVLVFQDPSSTAKAFFQSSGSINVMAGSDQLNGTVHTALTDVTLVEVTIDPTTFTSTPVSGGACLHITSAQIDVGPPPGWTCDPSYYNDGDCDCGCGVYDSDSDCADHTVASCDYCDDTNSCSADSCPGTIMPNNNATCTP